MAEGGVAPNEQGAGSLTEKGKRATELERGEGRKIERGGDRER